MTTIFQPWRANLYLIYFYFLQPSHIYFAILHIFHLKEKYRPTPKHQPLPRSIRSKLESSAWTEQDDYLKIEMAQLIDLLGWTFCFESKPPHMKANTEKFTMYIPLGPLQTLIKRLFLILIWLIKVHNVFLLTP
jgi:hypothetical protein